MFIMTYSDIKGIQTISSSRGKLINTGRSFNRECLKVQPQMMDFSSDCLNGVSATRASRIYCRESGITNVSLILINCNSAFILNEETANTESRGTIARMSSAVCRTFAGGEASSVAFLGYSSTKCKLLTIWMQIDFYKLTYALVTSSVTQGSFSNFTTLKIPTEKLKENLNWFYSFWIEIIEFDEEEEMAVRRENNSHCLSSLGMPNARMGKKAANKRNALCDILLP